MKVLFCGTPDFAVPALNKIYQSSHELVGVVTQPDRPNARGNKTEFSPVKKRGLELGLPVFQYEKISAHADEIAGLGADIMVTAAYGQILSQRILDITRYGVINIHASLLPKYRGSAPVRWAILAGEERLGISIMKTAFKVDSGDVLMQKSAIFADENYEECLAVLSELGGEIIVPALDSIETGRAIFTPQNEAEASYQPMIKKEDGKADFRKTALEFCAHVRAMNPWPSVYTDSKFGVMKIRRASATDFGQNGEEGTVMLADRKQGLFVNVNGGVVRVTELQLTGGKAMKDNDFLLGRSFDKGDKLGG